jgi:murein DD-endopeptidase MepM/ murein hydrolase activator NlpD
MSSVARAGALLLATLAITVSAPVPVPAVAFLPTRADADRPNRPVRPLAPVPAFGNAGTPRRLRDVSRLPRPRLVFPVRAAFNWGQGGARFGASRGGRSHEGQDVMARAGSPLGAIAAGEVVETGDDGGRGNYLALFDERAGATYVHLHMQSPPRVGVGQRVSAGQRLGEVGCTGSCFGDHLHFEARRGRGPGGPAMNPLPLLTRALEGSGPAAALPPGAG